MKDFPEVTDVEIAFGYSCKDWFYDTLKEAEKENLHNWEKRFSDLFFCGGSLNLNKSIPEEKLRKGIRLFKAIAGSFEPKHEHKEAVCAMILREIEEDI